MSKSSRKGDMDNNINSEKSIDDLFEKMKPKTTTTPNDEYENMDNNTRNIIKHGYDWYKVLGVDRNASLADVKTAFKKKLIIFHPDKYKSKDEKDKHENEQRYKLVREAGKILCDPKSRKMYDLQRKVVRNKDFVSQKNDFDEFIKLQESEITEQKRDMAKIQFQQDNDKLNKKRGFDPSLMDDKLTRRDTDQRMDDLMAQRDMQLMEATKPNPFDGRTFSINEFNKMFEKQKKKEEKKGKLDKDGQLTKYQGGLSAFNDTHASNFVSIESGFNDPFENEDEPFEGNNMFDKMRADSPTSDISISEGSDDIDVGYYDNHNKNRDQKNMDKTLEEFMRQRELETNTLSKLKHDDFKDAMSDPYGISKDFGVVIGADKTANQMKPRTTKGKIDYDMINIYNRMIGFKNENEEN